MFFNCFEPVQMGFVNNQSCAEIARNAIRSLAHVQSVYGALGGRAHARGKI